MRNFDAIPAKKSKI